MVFSWHTGRKNNLKGERLMQDSPRVGFCPLRAPMYTRDPMEQPLLPFIFHIVDATMLRASFQAFDG